MITLPWPPKELSPNARPHWAVKARAFKAYRLDCWATLTGHRKALRGSRAFRFTFHPPSKRRIDLDNCFAQIKACIDTLSDITGIDDSEFAYSIAMGAPVKGGSVVVSVDAEQARAA